MMKLFASPNSPYARLVRAAIIEKGLDAQVEYCWLNPWEKPPKLMRANPFTRVPTLVTSSGVAVSESLLILIHLERHHPDRALIPTQDDATTLHRLGLAMAVIDAAVDVVASRRFREQATDDPLVKRRLQTLRAQVPELAAFVRPGAGDAPDAGDIGLAVSLAYLDFRLPEIDWRSKAATLGQWLEAMSTRPSLKETRPEGG